MPRLPNTLFLLPLLPLLTFAISAAAYYAATFSPHLPSLPSIMLGPSSACRQRLNRCFLGPCEMREGEGEGVREMLARWTIAQWLRPTRAVLGAAGWCLRDLLPDAGDLALSAEY